jgi:hypothetical protein
MTDPGLPPWEGDPLSTFLSDAQQNERVSALKLPDVYALLQRVHVAFQQLATITEKEHHAKLLPTRFLMARAHAAWLAATRLGMSGQVVEAYPVLRVGVIEASWYALHLAKDPNPPTRVEIWLRRNEDGAVKARCKTEFNVTNVRATHAALDPATAAVLQSLYERTIELGAHPNERGILAAMTRTDTGQDHMFGVVFLTNNPVLIAVALKTAVEAAVGALKTFRLIFPERFAIMGMDDEIEKLVGGAQHGLRAVRAAGRRAGAGPRPTLVAPACNHRNRTA